jgi:hypothetical protein
MNETIGKIGRPALPREIKRWKFISTRISEGEYQAIVQAAKESGLGKTKWVRTRLVAAARRSPEKSTRNAIPPQPHRKVPESPTPQSGIMSDLTILD